MQIAYYIETTRQFNMGAQQPFSPRANSLYYKRFKP